MVNTDLQSIMMKHKFLELLDLRSNLEKLDKRGLLEWLEYFIDEQNGNDIIISRIFRQLYYEGENNDNVFLNQLIDKSNQLFDKNKSTKRTSVNNSVNKSNNVNNSNLNTISDLPNNVLSHIGTYLPTKDLFTSWNCVCHLFIQVGLSSNALKYWQFSDLNVNNIIQYPPKFRCDSILSQLQSIQLTSNFESLLNVSHLKWPEKVEIGECYIFYI